MQWSQTTDFTVVMKCVRFVEISFQVIHVSYKSILYLAQWLTVYHIEIDLAIGSRTCLLLILYVEILIEVIDWATTLYFGNMVKER